MPTSYIRQAIAEDSERILQIYRHYIENTVTTFEIEVPTLDDFSKKVENIASYYPYLLYVEGDSIIGYAYANMHRERAAYRFDVDVSIYLDHDFCGKGIGTKLYNKLFELLNHQGFYNAFSAITIPNIYSEALHKKFGFTDIGVYVNTGFKLGSWCSVKWLQKQIRDYDLNPSETVSIHTLPNNLLNC